MPAIGDLTHGYDAAGANAYLEALKADVIERAASSIEGEINYICSEFDKYWVGTAADSFKHGMRNGGHEMAQALRGLKDNLNALFNDMQEQFARNDRDMIDIG